MRSRNDCYRGKAISVIYSVCVFVALGTQRAKHMRRVTFLSVACPAVACFVHHIMNSTICGGESY